MLSQALDLAVLDQRIPRNPANGVKVARPNISPRRYLTHAQVERFAQAAGQWGDVIRVLAYTGIRWGEMAALEVGSIDLERRRASIYRTVVDTKGGLVWKNPKGHSKRAVPIPASILDGLAQAIEGRPSNELVFRSPKGTVLRVGNARPTWWNTAVIDAELPPGFHPHELRHTAASLAISAGANVKAVQQMLGHKSASLTLDTYADLFPDDLDAVANFLDSARLTSMNQDGSPTVVGKDVGTASERASPRSTAPSLISENKSGDEGNRTPNPRLAKAVLCQLSYVPEQPGRCTGPATTQGQRVVPVASSQSAASAAAASRRFLTMAAAPPTRAMSSSSFFMTAPSFR